MGTFQLAMFSLPGGKFLGTFLNVHQQDGGMACLKFEVHKNKKPTVRLYMYCRIVHKFQSRHLTSVINQSLPVEKVFGCHGI